MERYPMFLIGRNDIIKMSIMFKAIYRFNEISNFFLSFFFFFFFFFCLFRATPAAYGSSQARGLIRASAAVHRHVGSGPHLWPIPQLTTMLDPQPTLSEARDRTHVLMDTSRVHFCWTTTEIPWKEEGWVLKENIWFGFHILQGGWVWINSYWNDAKTDHPLITTLFILGNRGKH